ncbi:MAG TPA: SPOR domain-containing protein [Gammaproteobacteria bacterium]|nr:SPOR domain-containing protein [Gammaproteobacteria bacterium]
MDRQLKERLVGALVLVVLAIILIPTVLDGPDETSQTQALDLPPVEGAATDTPVQSYEFDLNGKDKVDEPEVTTPQKQQQAIIDASPVVNQADTTTAQEEKPTAAETSAPANNPVEAEPASVEPEPEAPEPAVEPSASEGEWAIQVGSFSKQQLAQDLADQLESQGYRVFLMEFTTGGVTYHRVRVGPFISETEAKKTAEKVHQATGGPAKVVSNQ